MIRSSAPFQLPLTNYQLLFMSNRSLWNWTIIIGAALAVLGVVVARVLEALLPADAINVVVAAFFVRRPGGMRWLIGGFVLSRPWRRGGGAGPWSPAPSGAALP